MEDPVHTGWLLATINLSDLAAAGAVAEGLVVNYTLPPATPRCAPCAGSWTGWTRARGQHGTQVLGGDIGEGHERRLLGHRLSAAAPRRFHPPAHGSVSTRLSRRGARAGDRLVLIGSPGYLWAAALLHHGFATVDDADREAVYARAAEPRAQLAAGRLLAVPG